MDKPSLSAHKEMSIFC